MWEPNLRKNIKHFIKQFGLVRKDQLLRFFQDQNANTVETIINDLFWGNELYEYGTSQISTSKALPYDVSIYDDTLTAIDVLCHFRSSEITYLYNTTYPAIVLFQHIDGTVYDITVFPSEQRDWEGTLTIAMRARKAAMVNGIEDIVKHIAVVPDINSQIMIETLVEFNYTIFATVDPETHFASLYELN